MEIFDKSRHAGGEILDFLPYNGDGRILFTTHSKQVSLTALRTAVVLLPQLCLKRQQISWRNPRSN
ncbi:uncharacterized protein BKA55DRAFT_357416 [Fusarium redolens]|uniref:Uncharacterized protein n=1 Tax=Fusarium redolens TaxID=48865 RepID=A0A9P9KJ04_FUSRE|nr:uncharacterized protein BKA55DRAFT_357416 [Fusarium redolens]KAH7254369.1 hypothetical protein BKA55DRAFT_357416 [Fusarium redolens]